jgi:Fe-S oxidoreductase
MATQGDELAQLFDRWGKEFAEQCNHCGDCLEACPVFPLTASCEMGPQTVMEKITDILKGDGISEEACEMVLSCTQGCGHVCAKACQLGLRPNFPLLSAVGRIVGSGRELPRLAYHLKPGDRYNFARVFSALQIKPSETRWMAEIPEDPEPVDVVFFAGCAATGMPHLLLETADILDRMGVNFVAIPGGERCCGVGQMTQGDFRGAQRAGEELVSALAAFKPKQAVFFCLGCQMVLSGILAGFRSIPFECKELSQFLVENVDGIPFKQASSRKVTLHDSCVLSGVPGYADIPRRLLQAIPGLTLVEMEHNREESLCCGGITNAMRPDIAQNMRTVPLDEAQSAGIEVLTTFCSGCHQSFAPFEHAYPYKIKNYVSLVAEAVGVDHEDLYKKYTNYRDTERVLAESHECIAANGFTLQEMEGALAGYSDLFSPRPDNEEGL